MASTINIVTSGCTHGELDVLYKTVEELESQSGKKVDLVICCGDFQAIRNWGDLEYMNCPPKYRALGTFYKYYSGMEKAPYLTIFIGGNHEASSYLSELPYGGWVAPNIYYMGFSSVVQFAGLRIAGLSGIFNYHNYNKGHFECVPYTRDTATSIYHVRSIDTFRLKQLEGSGKIDIMLTHDWPCGITKYGNEAELLRIKPYFRNDISANKLGNPHAMELLKILKPSYWFSAHMHVKFAALVDHGDGNLTRFLALDKPIPGRQFLQFIEIPIEEGAEKVLRYDESWLSILQNTDHLTVISNHDNYLPNSYSTQERYDFRPTEEEKSKVRKIFLDGYTIPTEFLMTAPPHIEDDVDSLNQGRGLSYENPQTTNLCEKLNIIDINKLFYQKANANYQGIPHYRLTGHIHDSLNAEISIDDLPDTP
uniref:Lariat debranching enzyme (inferred by orthology to a C. elegans protein) n=1 Tax=Strongyloides venezuelensis TaxID=75913 RepID=A0A0K0G1H4_STRVS